MSQDFLHNLPVVDAHHHFWDVEQNYHPWLCDEPMIPFRYGDYSSLRRNYLPEDYFRDCNGINVTATVYVETEWNPKDPIGETIWVHQLAETTGYPNAVVAQAWLDHDEVDAVLAGHTEYPLVRSVRHKPATRSRSDCARSFPGSMDDDKWRLGYSRLSEYQLHFDLQAPWWHFDQACDLVADFPDTTLILNHCGLPAERDSDSLKAWHTALAKLSEHDNVALKISGICQPDKDWHVEDNRWIVDEAIAMFGIERAMFASNFPVDGVCNSYRSIYDGFAKIVENFSQEDKRRLFHDNAMQIYSIV